MVKNDEGLEIGTQQVLNARLGRDRNSVLGEEILADDLSIVRVRYPRPISKVNTETFTTLETTQILASRSTLKHMPRLGKPHHIYLSYLYF